MRAPQHAVAARLGGLAHGVFPPSLYESTYPLTAVATAPRYLNPSGTRLPRPPYRPPEAFRVQARQVRSSTQWSVRALGRALGVSHPTASALLAGTGRHGNKLLGQLHSLYLFVARVHSLAGHNAAETSRALLHRDGSGSSAIDYLRDGDSPRAYLSALDALNPRRREQGLAVGSRPAGPRGATVELIDEDE